MTASSGGGPLRIGGAGTAPRGSPALFAAADALLGALHGEEPPAIRDARRLSDEAGLPDIAVSPPQGRFLSLLVRLCGGRSVVELGTLGGVGALWLAEGLGPDGRVTTIETDPGRCALARRATDGHAVDVVQGDGLEVLATVPPGSSDLVFFDANKEMLPRIFGPARRALRPGGLLVADNTVREGRIIEPAAADTAARSVRAFLEALGTDPHWQSATLQTVGAKGHDGMTLAVRL